MSKREKRLQKLLAKPGETSLRTISAILNDFGYKLTRVNGSHHIFEKNDQDLINLPVHNGKVKKCYIKIIIKKLISRQNEI